MRRLPVQICGAAQAFVLRARRPDPDNACGAGLQLAEQQKFDDAGAMFRSCAELATTDEQRGHAKDMLATTLMDRGHEMGDEDALGMYKQAWNIWTKELHVDPGNDNLVR